MLRLLVKLKKMNIIRNIKSVRNILIFMSTPHRALAFDFCYHLDLCPQGQAVRASFIQMGFFPNLVKGVRGILIKHV